MEKELRIAVATILAAASVVVLKNPAFAITAPSPGSSLYELYDIGVNQLLKGPLGFVGGVGCIVLGAVNVFKHPLQAVPAILAGGAMLKADSIVTSMGMII